MPMMHTTHLQYKDEVLPLDWESVVGKYPGARRKIVITLEIINCDVKLLPKWVTELHSLKKLWLSGNVLWALPDELANLTQLEELCLEYTQLSELPYVVTQLHSLKRLWLNGNELRTLPDELARLAQLEELDISDNYFIEIPRILGSLPAIDKVFDYLSSAITDARRQWRQHKARMNMRARAFHIAMVAVAHNPAAAAVAQRRLPAHLAAELGV
jgi:hypothetical protein